MANCWWYNWNLLIDSFNLLSIMQENVAPVCFFSYIIITIVLNVIFVIKNVYFNVIIYSFIVLLFIFHKQPGAFDFFHGHLLPTLWDWNNPIWKYFVHDHHSNFSRNGWYKHYMPSCRFQGTLTKDGRFSTSHLNDNLSFSPHSVVCFHLRLYLPFFSVFSQGLLPSWTSSPTSEMALTF